MAEHTDVNYENAILVYGLPRNLVPIASKRIREFIPRTKILTANIDSYGLKVFFKEYDPVRKAISKKYLCINRRNYFIHLLITPLTIHGIASFVNIKQLERFLQPWGQIYRIYQEEKPNYLDSNQFDKTDNYRVILIRSDAERFTPPKTLRIPFVDREFDVTLYCRHCLKNGHNRWNCQKLPECNKGENIKLEQSSNSIQVKKAPLERSQSLTSWGEFQEICEPYYWTQAGSGEDWRKCKESDEKNESCFEKNCFTQSDEPHVEYKLIKGEYSNVMTSCENQNISEYVSRTNSWPKSKYKHDLYQNTRSFSFPCSSTDADNTDSLNERRLIQNCYPFSETNSHWEKMASIHDVQEVKAELSSVSNEFPVPDGPSKWPTKSETHHFVEGEREVCSPLPNISFLPRERVKRESFSKINRLAERQPECSSSVVSYHLLERPSTSSNNPGTQFRNSLDYKSPLFKDSTPTNSNNETKDFSPYDWRKSESELPSTDDEGNSPVNNFRSSYMFFDTGMTMSSLSDEELRVTSPHELNCSRQISQVSEYDCTGVPTAKNFSEFSFQKEKYQDRNINEEKQSNIDFESLVPRHLKDKSKELRKFSKALAQGSERVSINNKNIIHHLEEIVEFNQRKLQYLTLKEQKFINWLQKQTKTFKKTHKLQQKISNEINAGDHNENSKLWKKTEQNLTPRDQPQLKQKYKTESIANSADSLTDSSISRDKSVVRNFKGMAFEKRRYLKLKGSKQKPTFSKQTDNHSADSFGECSTSRKEESSIYPESDSDDSKPEYPPHNLKGRSIKEHHVRRQNYVYQQKTRIFPEIHKHKNRKRKLPHADKCNTRTANISEEFTPGLHNALQQTKGILSYAEFLLFLTHSRGLKHPGKNLKHYIKRWDNIPEKVDCVINQLQGILNYFYAGRIRGRGDHQEARILQDLLKRLREHKRNICESCFCWKE